MKVTGTRWKSEIVLIFGEEDGPVAHCLVRVLEGADVINQL
jgi:hypothetical protein